MYFASSRVFFLSRLEVWDKPLRMMFVDRLRLRGLSERTVDNYAQAVAALPAHHGRSPLGMTVEQVRVHLLHVLRERKRAPSTVNLHIAALRTFYALMEPGNDAWTPSKR